jgi:hypothetical protein
MDTEAPPIELAITRAGRALALETGEGMAGYVTNRLLHSILDTSAGAEAAGVKKENAVACFIHLCRAACGDLCKPAGMKTLVKLNSDSLVRTYTNL